MDLNVMAFIQEPAFIDKWSFLQSVDPTLSNSISRSPGELRRNPKFILDHYL